MLTANQIPICGETMDNGEVRETLFPRLSSHLERKCSALERDVVADPRNRMWLPLIRPTLAKQNVPYLWNGEQSSTKVVQLVSVIGDNYGLLRLTA